MSDVLRALDLDICDALRNDDFLAGVFITTLRPRVQTLDGVMQSHLNEPSSSTARSRRAPTATACLNRNTIFAYDA